ncbi:MAG: ribosome small subunit-dependent GTPase A [Myxococcota bacterium]
MSSHDSDPSRTPIQAGATVSEALSALGFNSFFLEQWQAYSVEHAESSAVPERVAAEWRGEYTLMGASGSRRALLSGRLRHELSSDELPCVGDWVLAEDIADRARIEHVFRRSGCFVRKAAGGTSQVQPIAANVDIAFIVCSLLEEGADPFALAHALNPRRIERYLLAASQAAARPIVLLNKSDLRADSSEHARSLSLALSGAEVLPVSAATRDGLAAVEAVLQPGLTAVLVGSSGVGKSSLLNAFAGQATQAVQEVRKSDAHGRHTTTHRELFLLSSGAILIDTPGMREFGLHADDESSNVDSAALAQIERLAENCRFRDCKHQAEPGCAVRAAAERGELPAGSLEQHDALLRELSHQRTRSLARKQQEQHRKRVSEQRSRAGKRERE